MTNIYQTFYNLLQTYVFGGEILASTPQELIAVLLSTCAVIAVVALPFFVVYRIISFIVGV